MPKSKPKTNKKVSPKVIKKVAPHEVKPFHLHVSEDLPEDVQVALGIKRVPKAKIKEVDYVAELENEDNEDLGTSSEEMDSSFE